MLAAWISTTTSPGPATGSGTSPYWNLSTPPCPVRNTAFMASPSEWRHCERSEPISCSLRSARRDCFVAALLAMTAMGLNRRRHRQPADDAVALDQVGDQAVLFRLLDKVAQERIGRIVLLRRSDR